MERRFKIFERNKFNNQTTGSNQLVSSEKENKATVKTKTSYEKRPRANINGQIPSN